ncbi:MAG TPA: NAD-dependent epimerase/dehydratase family protein [Terriglobales bacterium]
MRRILITGGCGFIGTNLSEYLLRSGDYQLTLFDNFSNAVYDAELSRRNGSSIRVIRGDIRDERACFDAVARQDAVVHLAAFTRVPDSLDNPVECYRANIQGIIHLLEACKKQDISRFVFASSNAAVGSCMSAVNEQMAATPKSPYGASKMAGEALCSAYWHSFGIPTVALRFSNVYGPHCQRKPSVVAKFLRTMLEGDSLTIFGDGSQTRDFVHVKDVCQAIELCLSPASRTRVEGEVFQVGTGVETSILELANILASVTNLQPNIRFEPPRAGDIPRNRSDITKIKHILGYTPRFDLEDGVRNLYKWHCDKTSGAATNALTCN